jgi:hypothetical protein
MINKDFEAAEVCIPALEESSGKIAIEGGVEAEESSEELAIKGGAEVEMVGNREGVTSVGVRGGKTAARTSRHRNPRSHDRSTGELHGRGEVAGRSI